MTEGWQRLITRIDPASYLRHYGLAALAFIPALVLSGLWFGARGVMLVGALTLPGILIASGAMPPPLPASDRHRHRPSNGVEGTLQAKLEAGLRQPDGSRTAALVLALDDADALRQQYGAEAFDDVLKACGARLDAALRDGDVLAPHGTTGFAVALASGRRLDLEALVQLAARLQQALADPVTVGAHGLHLTASVGYCLPRRPEEHTAAGCLAAADTALAEAQLYGPGAIRAFVPDRARSGGATPSFAEELPRAFDAGEIVPWFQPQLSTDTGAVSGMEALARWDHPKLGLIAPGDFLPAIEALGLEQRLTDAILAGAFEALQAWDAAVHSIESVGVNFAGADLADPMLADRIRWELDRQSVEPERLTIEILETVIAQGSDDTVTRSIQRLAALGCRIDLDDFGTGHAAIGSIRRFSVGRIKIDRSFVTRIDTDAEQQTMVTAILELADRLGLDTLAEGVETVGEHTLLAQLGCGHVQGFSIARPMPLADTLPWLDRHRTRLEATVWPQRRVG